MELMSITSWNIIPKHFQSMWVILIFVDILMMKPKFY